MNANKNKAASKAAGASAGARQQNPAVVEMIEILTKWEEERPRKEKGRVLLYCPICTNTASVSYSTAKKSPPKCPRCGVDMVRYDEDAFAKRRRELAEKAKRVLPSLVDVFTKAAEIYKRSIETWYIGDGYIEFRMDGYDPTEFVYDFAHDLVLARLYFFDLPHYREAADYLMAEVKRLGLRVELEIYPPHTDPQLLPPEAKYDVERNKYVIVAP
jgi:transposase-like protein